MELIRDIDVYRRRYMLHWSADEGTYLITFSLFDAVPPTLRPGRLKKMDATLDRGYGSSFMWQPEIASLVFDALKFFDGIRYYLHAICVMPNHVHAVARMEQGIAVGEVVRSWKTFTARRANQLLRRQGRFWQEEWHDWLIHDRNQLDAVVRYVMSNPVSGGLGAWPWVQRFDRELVVKYQ